MSVDGNAPLYGTTEDGYEYKSINEYVDLTLTPTAANSFDEFGNKVSYKKTRDAAELQKGIESQNKSRIKGMQGKKSPLLSTGDQSKVRNVLSSGISDAVNTGLGAGQTAAKTLLGV